MFCFLLSRGLSFLFMLVAACHLVAHPVGNRIMRAPARTITITMRFKSRLPFRFERQFHERLLTAVHHCQDGEGTPFGCSWLWNPHPSHRPGGLVVPVFGVNGGRHRQSLSGSERFDAIDSRSILTLILLGNPAHCQQSGRFRFHQALLQVMSRLYVATL